MGNIMITGATGKLGGLTIDHLLKKRSVSSDQIIALVRDKTKAIHLEKKGIQLRTGSYEDIDSLKESFLGVEKLLIISSPSLDNATRIQQFYNVVMAAKSSQVGHIFYVGLAHPEEKVFGLEDVELATEHIIRALDIPFTFLRNGVYLDEISPDVNAAVKSNELISSTMGKLFNYVLRNDLALANATVLTEDGHENKTYELVRSELISFPQIAAILSEIFGREILYKELPIMQTIDYLEGAGVAKEAAESLVNVFHKAIADEKFKATGNDLTSILGDQITPIDKAIQSLIK